MFNVSSNRLEKPGIEPQNAGLLGEFCLFGLWFNP